MSTISSTLATRPRRQSINLLFMIALAVDLLTPTLIWWQILPSSVRWLSHAAILLMMIGIFTRMMAFDQVPSIVWLVLGVSLFWSSVALLDGQGLIATGWGWWVLFQFPLAGLFAYLQPSWPERFPAYLLTFLLAIGTLEFVVQAGQVISGGEPGDLIGGTFGAGGTGTLVVFLLLSIAMALGHWLSSRKLWPLLWLLVIGLGSSILGEMKLFPLGVLLLGVASLVLDMIRNQRLLRLIPAVAAFALVIVSFTLLYDTFIVPLSPGNRTIASFIDPEDTELNRYLNISTQVSSNQYDIGRNYAIRYAWDSIQQDPLTFLLGEGLGARGESRTFNTAGLALQKGNLGLTSGTSLMVFLQEFGVVGMAVLSSFILWIFLTLLRDAWRYPASPALPLRYGLALFTLLWPLLLWYNHAWTLRAPMLIYWVVLGYVLSETYQRRHVPKPPLPTCS